MASFSGTGRTAADSARSLLQYLTFYQRACRTVTHHALYRHHIQFFTRHSVSESSASIWVGMPASASLLIMKWLNLLFTIPLRSNCSMRAPSPADVSLRNSSTSSPGSRCCKRSSLYHDTTQLASSSFTTPVILSQKNTSRPIHKSIQSASRRQLSESPGAYKSKGLGERKQPTKRRFEG